LKLLRTFTLQDGSYGYDIFVIASSYVLVLTLPARLLPAGLSDQR